MFDLNLLKVLALKTNSLVVQLEQNYRTCILFAKFIALKHAFRRMRGTEKQQLNILKLGKSPYFPRYCVIYGPCFADPLRVILSSPDNTKVNLKISVVARRNLGKRAEIIQKSSNVLVNYTFPWNSLMINRRIRQATTIIVNFISSTFHIIKTFQETPNSS